MFCYGFSCCLRSFVRHRPSSFIVRSSDRPSNSSTTMSNPPIIRLLRPLLSRSFTLSRPLSSRGSPSPAAASPSSPPLFGAAKAANEKAVAPAKKRLPTRPPPSTTLYSVIDSLGPSSTIPYTEEYFPRQYPFPLVIRSSIPRPENIETQPIRPHDHPIYKTEISVDIRDLPLSHDERAVFKALIGRRYSNADFNAAHDRAFNFPKSYERMKKHVGKFPENPFMVSFVCRHFPNQRASENGAFFMLEECIKQAKIIAHEYNGKLFQTPVEEKDEPWVKPVKKVKAKAVEGAATEATKDAKEKKEKVKAKAGEAKEIKKETAKK